jgi:hypothetical protein
MNRRNTLSTIALCIATAATLSSSAQSAAGVKAKSTTNIAVKASGDIARSGIRITSPKPGARVGGEEFVKVKISLATGAKKSTLHVRLNGHDVSAQFERQACTATECTMTANLSADDGLRDGENRMEAMAHRADRSLATDHMKFDHQLSASLQDAPPAQYTPNSIGFNLTPGGAQPWVRITTGYSSSDPAASATPVTMSTPYPNTTYSTNCNGLPWQVVRLNRAAPTQMIEQACFGSAGDLKDYLHGLASSSNGTELVAVGTCEHYNADAGLDTTDIGGSNYSGVAVANLPLGYAAIGVPGAPAGTAYEDFYTTGDHNWQMPFVSGNLVSSSSNPNYNFMAGDSVVFEAHSNDSMGTFVSIQPGGAIETYAPPVGFDPDGMWLLVIDRNSLLPPDWNTSGLCWSENKTCGKFFDTGNTDPSISANSMAALNQALAAVTARQMIFLVAVGQAFPTKPANPSYKAWSSTDAYGIKEAVDKFGGAGYSLTYLNQPGSAYTLVSQVGAPGACYLGTCSINANPVAPPPNSPFSSGVILSTSANNTQGQTGYVRGVLNRDIHGLYYVSLGSQENAATEAKTHSKAVDLTYHIILGQDSSNWPDTDTPGHYAAYHYLSGKMIQDFSFGETGSHIYDLRWFYTGDRQDAANLAADAAHIETYSTYPGDGHGFTQDEYNQVYQDLNTELQMFRGSYGYLGPDGLGTIIEGGVNSATVQAIEASSQLTEGQTEKSQAQVTVSDNPTNWMSLVSGVVGIVGPALGPEMPIASAALGMISGSLSAAGSFDWDGPSSSTTYPTPPSAQNGFDQTLAQAIANASAQADSMESGYESSLALIYNDAGRLKAVGTQTNDSDGTWNMPDTSKSTLIGGLTNGIKRSLFLQALPQLFQIDTYRHVAVQTPNEINRAFFVNDGSETGKLYCSSVSSAYKGNVAQQYGSARYPSTVQSSNYQLLDFYVLGGLLNYDNTTAATESLPSMDLLRTLFANEQPTNSDGSPNLAAYTLNLPYLELQADSNALPLAPGPILLPKSGASPEQTVDMGSNTDFCYQPNCSTSGDNPDACKINIKY